MFRQKFQIKIIFLFLLFSFFFFNVFSFSGSGSGTVPDPYEITTCLELQEIEDNLSANYELLNDVDCSSISNFRRLGGCVGTCVVGGDDLPFSGEFNGNGYTISDVTMINLTTTDEGWGLFGNLENGSISNISLSNAFINVTGNYVGSLVGSSSSSSSVNGSYSSGLVTGINYVGGLVGSSSSSSSVNGSYSSSTVTGIEYVGGLIGGSFSSSVFNSYSSSSVTGIDYVGGLLGLSFLSSVFDSYSSSDVNGNRSVGGLVGVNFNSNVYNSFSVGNVNASNFSNSGSFIGVFTSVTLTNNYWNNVSGNPNISVGSGSDVGISVTQDNVSWYYDNTNSPLSSWDVNIWGFTGSDLPYLIGVSPTPYLSLNNSTSSTFPFGSMYIPLGFLLMYFIFQ